MKPILIASTDSEEAHPPFLMLTPPDNLQAIVDIMKIGIRYVPKIPDYQDLLGLTANNTLAQILEQEQLRENALRLKNRIEELEKAESEVGEKEDRRPSSETEYY